MLITFSQSGGFAGLLRSCQIDTAALAAADRDRLETLVNQSGLLRLGLPGGQTNSRSEPVAQHSGAGRDRRCYEVAIERDGVRVEYACDDSALPAAAAPLVHWLRERAQPG